MVTLRILNSSRALHFLSSTQHCRTLRLARAYLTLTRASSLVVPLLGSNPAEALTEGDPDSLSPRPRGPNPGELGVSQPNERSHRSELDQLT
jgi:hypothetical protein